MIDTVLHITGLSKAFGGVQALDKVDLSIRKGEIHCLAGGNGSGKSTLIKLVSGYYQPDAGSITLGDKVFQRLTPIEAINQGVQVIYQDFSVFPNMTVAENIALSDAVASGQKLVNWRRFKERAAEAITMIGVDLPLNAKVEDLSVADKQLTAIARAILYKAKLLIMDEPTTALTRREVDKLFAIVRRLQAQGLSILFVSHKLDEVFEIADRFTILRNGRHIVTDRTANVTHEKFIHYMTGRSISTQLFQPAMDVEAAPLFEVRDLSLQHGFSDISFSVYPGEIIGIIGLLGSGRTELAESLFGLHPADSGEVRIAGQLAQITSPQAAIAQGIGYVPEDRLSEGLALSQPILRNLAIVNIDALTAGRSRIDQGKVGQAMAYWRQEMDMTMQSPDKPIQTMSGGNQQKVVLAKWLEIKPKVLLLNGPTVGVDVGAKYDLHQYLRHLAAAGDIAIVIISDDVEEVLENCNRVFVMNKGRFAGQFRNTDITQQGLLQYMTEQRQIS